MFCASLARPSAMATLAAGQLLPGRKEGVTVWRLVEWPATEADGTQEALLRRLLRCPPTCQVMHVTLGLASGGLIYSPGGCGREQGVGPVQGGVLR